MKITVKEKYRTLEKDWVYDFSLLKELKTLTIVGENGCGKSSLLQALRGHIDEPNNKSLHKYDFQKLASNISIEHDYEKIFFFDAVKDNGVDFMNAYDAVGLIDSGGFQAQNISHGQGAMMYMSRFLRLNSDKIIPDKTLVVFDEIDNGLSLGNLARFQNFIYGLNLNHKCDVLIISHNPFFISQSLIVYDFNKRKIVTADDYIKEVTGFKLDKENNKK